MYLLKSNKGHKIIWFNPPCSCNVATDIGKQFFLLLDKHFPKTYNFYKKMFNRNNVKVSHSSVLISSKTKSHNKKVLSNNESKSSKSSCNCRDKSPCPLNGNCLQQNQALSGKACYRTHTRSHTRKRVQKCDKSHAEIKLRTTCFYYLIAFI